MKLLWKLDNRWNAFIFFLLVVYFYAFLVGLVTFNVTKGPLVLYWFNGLDYERCLEMISNFTHSVMVYTIWLSYTED